MRVRSSTSSRRSCSDAESSRARSSSSPTRSLLASSTATRNTAAVVEDATMRSAAEVLDLPSSGAASSGPRFPTASGTAPARQPCTRVITSRNSAKPIMAGTDQGQGQVVAPSCSETSGRIQTARQASTLAARGRGTASSAAPARAAPSGTASTIGVA